MSSSDSEDDAVENVYGGKRAQNKIHDSEKTNFCVLTPNTVRGELVSDEGREATAFEVAEALEVRRLPSRREEDAVAHVRKRMRGVASSTMHGITDFVTWHSQGVSERLARGSILLRHYADLGHGQLPHGKWLCAENSRTVDELKHLIENNLRTLGQTQRRLTKALQCQPADVVVQQLVRQVEEEDVWGRVMRGARNPGDAPDIYVEDGVLISNGYMPDYTEEVDIHDINNSLRPFVEDEPFTRPCMHGSRCVACASNVVGVPLDARPDRSQPMRALLPPDVLRAWRESGNPPADDFPCWKCMVACVEERVEFFTQKQMQSPWPLNPVSVRRDDTGQHGFPSWSLHSNYDAVGRRGTGIVGNFPRASMLDYVVVPSGKGKKGRNDTGQLRLCVTDFRFSSVASSTE